ncbi:uncharacterized protein CIMG_13601 [Coccidioides immitis RS]|uniref:Uncharacterized protein n=1 Tax=Coccidioides immitis (strain RS) TaxID=246410 RepID=A0A0D8JW57_COCIM|nr:uncharacterized protein CIMG_13601 [Coccidioides immitis RS]KJF61359.1 hypothetical protein CIMG_13601 [Coccidioides immitis RS]
MRRILTKHMALQFYPPSLINKAARERANPRSNIFIAESYDNPCDNCKELIKRCAGRGPQLISCTKRGHSINVVIPQKKLAADSLHVCTAGMYAVIIAIFPTTNG